MSLHVTIPRIRVHRPTLPEVRMISRFVAVGAGLPAGVLAVGAGFTWPVLVAAAAALGSVTGSRRTGRRWQRRYEAFAAGVDANNRAIHLQLAQYERVAVERWNREAVERNSRWAALNDSRVQPGAGQPNKGYR